MKEAASSESSTSSTRALAKAFMKWLEPTGAPIVGDLHLALSTAGDAELSDGLCRGPWGFSKGLLWGENDPIVVMERALEFGGVKFPPALVARDYRGRMPHQGDIIGVRQHDHVWEFALELLDIGVNNGSEDETPQAAPLPRAHRVFDNGRVVDAGLGESDGRL